MSSRLSSAQLDAILSLQLTVAWAGEAAGESPRLGWWKTDLTDREGGGDLFARLVPRTAPWATLGLVREAARRVDEGLRMKLARADGVWTLFHFGFAVDEQLADRLTFHRNHEHVPVAVFGEGFLPASPWSRDAFESMLGRAGKEKAEITPAGRKIALRLATPPDAAARLASALLPLAPAYPLPFAEAPP